jgi:FkbM family methyltransferase
MLQNIRVRLVKGLIDFNEKLFFEWKLAKAYKNLFRDNIETVLDVGANKGQSIAFFLNLNRNCTIHAFEPNTGLYHRLMRKYGTLPGVRIYNMGVSDQTGQRMFQENILDYTSSFEELNPNSKYLQNKSTILGIKSQDIIKDKYIVDTITLADFINTHVTGTVDVLKIDIEGHEYAALTGLFKTPIKHAIRFIQIENHTDDMYLNKVPFEAMRGLLAANGFNVKMIIKHGFGKINELIFYNTAF